MRTFAQKPNGSLVSRTVECTQLNPALCDSDRRANPVLLQRAIGNQTLQRMPQANAAESHAELPTAAERLGYSLGRMSVYRPSVQARTLTDAAEDALEREADRVADQVVRMPEPRQRDSCPCGGKRPERLAGHPEQVRPLAEPAGAGGSRPVASPPSVFEALALPGRPLDTETRAFMETRFGHDFSDVRLHTDARAAQAARSINAKAFTVGRDIAFGAGHSDVGGRDGRQLLAHELTHVLQQRASPNAALARKVDVPAVDNLLRDALVRSLASMPGGPAAGATYFYKADDETPSYRISDPALAASRASSTIQALLTTFNRLHWAILQHLDRVPKRASAKIPDPPPGDVKLAMDDAPDSSARRIIGLTARDLGWNIEVLIPVLGRDSGRVAVDKAAAEKRLSQISLKTLEEVNPKKQKARKLGGFGPPACIPMPPHRIRWVIGKSGLHIDAGGTGKKIADSGGSYNVGYEDANNLNLAATEGTDANGRPMKIPNLVCGNINDVWPIGDDRADLVTTHSAPIHAKEIARVIKRNGRIFLTGPEVNGKFQNLLQELANRGKQVDTIDALEDPDTPKTIDKIDIRLATNAQTTQGENRDKK